MPPNIEESANPTSFLSPDEIAQLGFRRVGAASQISRYARIYGASSISLGDHVRIDDFTIVSARENIDIGSYVHIAARASLFGGAGMEIGDFAGVSGGASIYSESDDFSGQFLAGPTIPPAFTAVSGGRISLGHFSLIGSGAVVLPGADIGTGAAVGALSLVNRPVEPWTIVGGQPARFLAERRQDMVGHAQVLLMEDH